MKTQYIIAREEYQMLVHFYIDNTVPDSLYNDPNWDTTFYIPSPITKVVEFLVEDYDKKDPKREFRSLSGRNEDDIFRIIAELKSQGFRCTKTEDE